jgi:hypothetical protein
VGSAGKRREPLDVHAEQAGDGLGLGVAELGELLGHSPHRAVSLAELDAGQAARADRPGAGREAVLGHRLDEDRRPGHNVVSGGVEACRIPALEAADSLPREGGDGVGSSVLVEVTQGLGGEFVVGARQRAVPPLGDHVGTGRTAPAAGVCRTRVVLLDGTVVGQGVEMPADRRGGQPQQSPDIGRRDRTVLGHGGEHAFARALLVRSDKHHTIVT